MSTEAADRHVERHDKMRDISDRTETFSASQLSLPAGKAETKPTPKFQTNIAFDPSVYPDGTLLWKTMRAQEAITSASLKEYGAPKAGLFDEAPEGVTEPERAASTQATEPEVPAQIQPAPTGYVPQEFSMDTKLVGQAQWSLSALDHVFTHMASSFMEQVDFNQIDFDALAQA